MHNQSMGDAFGVEELSLEMAEAIEGGAFGPIFTAVAIGLILYAVNNAGEFVHGVSDGWNAYQP
jgi:hypothetical protein